MRRLCLLCGRRRLGWRRRRLDLLRGRLGGRFGLLYRRSRMHRRRWLHLLRGRSRVRRLCLLCGRRRLGWRRRRLDLLCRRRFWTRGRRLTPLRRATSGLPRSTGSPFRTAALRAIGLLRRLLLLRKKRHACLERRSNARRREQRDGNDRASKKQSPCRLLLSHDHPHSAGWRDKANSSRGLEGRR